MEERKSELRTLKQMADVLNVNIATLRSWAKAEIIPYYRIGKKYYFNADEILKASASSGISEQSKKIKEFCGNNNGLSISNGYVQVKIGNHPMANNNGYIPLHRLIMQAKIGRPLTENEIVHPKNGNTLDFNIDNLEIVETLGKHNKENRSLREDR